MWEELHKLSEAARVTLGGLLMALIAGASFAWKKFLGLRKETAATKTVEAEEQTKRTEEKTKQAEQKVEIQKHESKAEEFRSHREILKTMTQQAQEYAESIGEKEKSIAQKDALIIDLLAKHTELLKRTESLEKTLNSRVVISAEGYALLYRPLVPRGVQCPLCIFDAAEETMTFTGTSLVVGLEAEEIFKAYIAFIHYWFEERLLPEENHQNLQIIFALDDYSTKTRGWIHELCSVANSYFTSEQNKKNVHLQWHVMKEQETMVEDVSLFMDGLSVPFDVKLF